MRNPRMIQRFAVGIAVAAIAALCLATIAADSSRAEKIPAAVDAAQFADFMANEALDVRDLAEGAEIQRRFFNCITPPGVSLLQPMFPAVAPFDAANFDAAFLEDLLGEDKNTVAIYPLSLALDPKTRETLVCNAEGTLIAVLPAERDFRAWRDDADPARVTLLLDLLPAEDVEPYLYAESRIAESAGSKTAKSAKRCGVAKMSLETNEFGICDIRKLTDDSMRILVTNWTAEAELYAYTVAHTSSVVVAGWTNEYGVPANTNIIWSPESPPFNGIESGWECLSTNLLFTNRVAVWEDANIPGDARVRFYAAAKRVDSDGDGLTDGEETFLRRTDPGLADTDGDTIPDGAEISLGLDPLDAADAAEDPDIDELTNLEEWELGTDILGSNIVQTMYFVDQLPDDAMRRGAAETNLYVSWSNLQAKAIRTARYKDGYREYTASNLPPSDPPKYYMAKTRRYQTECNGSNPFDVGRMNFFLSQSNYCRKAFDPLGWPNSPSNHVCTGQSVFSRTYTGECFEATELAWDVSYTTPSSSAPFLVTGSFQQTCWPFASSNSQSYWHHDTCALDMISGSGSLVGQGIPTSHTEAFAFRTGAHFIACASYADPPYEIFEESLADEYTDAMLRSCTDIDLQMMTNWDGLAWGRRINRNNQYQAPATNSLSTNHVYASRHALYGYSQIDLQALCFRWAFPTAAGVVYKINWQEDYFPDDWLLPIGTEWRTCNVLGTGATAYSPDLKRFPPEAEGFIKLVPASKVRLEIYRPLVLDPGESMIPEEEKQAKGGIAFVNHDNDDNDAFFDNGGAAADILVDGGDDELVKIQLKYQAPSWAPRTVRLFATAGATNVAVWTSSNKTPSSAYAFGGNLAGFAYVSNWYVKTMWVEGISPHAVQRGTKLKLELGIGGKICEDEVALTVVGVDQITWKGKGNGVNDGDALDNDPNWPGGLAPNASRVFPDARAVGGIVEPDARDRVDVEVSLTVAPPGELKLYLRSFDVDDPTAGTNVVDDESMADDNRGATPAQAGQFAGESGGVLELGFPENVKTANCEFQTTMQPGDNFRIAANGDKDFLATLANNDVTQNTGGGEADRNANKQRLVCTNITGTVAEQEIRLADNYASDVLTVWRFLHVEVDSMAAPPTTGAEMNTVDGTLTAIVGNGTVAQRAFLNINLNTGLTPQDPSANLSTMTGNGRFENGWIKIGSGTGTPGETQTIDLLGNGDDYARKDGGIDVPVLVSKTGQADVSGKVIAWSGTTFTLSVSTGALSTNYNGGTLNVAGIAATVSAVSTNGGINTVTVTTAPAIPFILHDDDVDSRLSFTLPSTMMNFAFGGAYHAPLYDGGNSVSNNQSGTNSSVAFRRNATGAQLDSIAQRGSATSESDYFWIVYVCSAWQYNTDSDDDPQSEGGAGGVCLADVNNNSVAQGGNASWVFVETCNDRLIKDVPPADAGLIERDVVHEIGHQMGLDHLSDTILNSSQQAVPLQVGFGAVHLHLLRSRMKSPGE